MPPAGRRRSELPNPQRRGSPFRDGRSLPGGLPPLSRGRMNLQRSRPARPLAAGPRVAARPAGSNLRRRARDEDRDTNGDHASGEDRDSTGDPLSPTGQRGDREDPRREEQQRHSQSALHLCPIDAQSQERVVRQEDDGAQSVEKRTENPSRLGPPSDRCRTRRHHSASVNVMRREASSYHSERSSMAVAEPPGSVGPSSSTSTVSQARPRRTWALIAKSIAFCRPRKD
jgi:hypothetical protein